MSIPDGNMANAVYHSAILSGMAMGYARLGKMILKGSTLKLDFTGYDMVVLDVALAMAT